MDTRIVFLVFHSVVLSSVASPAYYQFGYQVDTLDTGDYHGHMEQLDQQGRKSGEFKVRLPDGRIQVTSYQADEAGFRPRISYEVDPLFVPQAALGGFTPEKKVIKRPPPRSYDDTSLKSYLPPPINYDPRDARPKPSHTLLTPDPPLPAYQSPTEYQDPSPNYGPPTRTYAPPNIDYQAQKYAPPPIHYEPVYNHVVPDIYTPPIERYSTEEDIVDHSDLFREALRKQPETNGEQKYFLVPIKGESGTKPILALLVKKKH